MKPDSTPLVLSFTPRAVKAPLPHPHKTASGTLEVAPLVLLDVETNAGITGSSYVFVYTPLALAPVTSLLKNLQELVVGKPLAPLTVAESLQSKFRLLGNQGLTGIAMAAIDMALWDALAKLNEMPLYRLLGADLKSLRVYDSLGQKSPDETAREVEQSLKNGFRAFKVKAGHPDPITDVAVARAIKRVAGEDAWFAMDFNQAFSAAESIERMRQLDDEGLAWIEEPVRAEDYAGHARVRQAIRTPIQTGENWWGIADMTKAICAQASDLVMPDAMKIGGVTGWMAAASLAAAHGLAVSSHLFIEISAHLLTVTATAHMLEWFDIAGSLTETHPSVNEGVTQPLDLPGSGLIWNEKAVDRYSV